MKALTVYQPWASLLAYGLKHYETRSWAPKYRGPLLIHAGQRQLEFSDRVVLWQSTQRKEFLSSFEPGQGVYDKLPFGKVLCLVDLVACFPAESVITHNPNERYLGDFSPGRFAWELANVRRFKEPWDLRGSQNIYNVPDELVATHELVST